MGRGTTESEYRCMDLPRLELTDVIANSFANASDRGDGMK